MAVCMLYSKCSSLIFSCLFVAIGLFCEKNEACQFFLDKKQNLNDFPSLFFHKPSCAIPRPRSTGLDQEKNKKRLLTIDEKKERISTFIKGTPFRNKEKFLDLIKGSHELSNLYFAIFSSNTPVFSALKLDKVIKTLILETITRYHNDQNDMYPLRIISSHDGALTHSFIVISRNEEDLKSCVVGLCDRLSQKTFILGGHGQAFLYGRGDFMKEKQSTPAWTSREQDTGTTLSLTKENLGENLGRNLRENLGGNLGGNLGENCLDDREDIIPSRCNYLVFQPKWLKEALLTYSTPQNQSKVSDMGFYIAFYKNSLSEREDGSFLSEATENEEGIDEDKGSEVNFFLCFEPLSNLPVAVQDSSQRTLSRSTFIPLNPFLNPAS